MRLDAASDHRRWEQGVILDGEDSFLENADAVSLESLILFSRLCVSPCRWRGLGAKGRLGGLPGATALGISGRDGLDPCIASGLNIRSPQLEHS
jgi:hypothetical protein